MEPRSVQVILTEWRAVERDLDAFDEERDPDPDRDREFLQARIAALRAEHRAALAAREEEAERLRSLRVDPD